LQEFTTRQQNNKTTKQQDNKTTRQQNNKTTKQFIDVLLLIVSLVDTCDTSVTT